MPTPSTLVKLEIGDAVRIRPHFSMPKKYQLQFAEVVGVSGAKHCEAGEMYSVEFYPGHTGIICCCVLLRLPKHTEPARWAHCVWKPKKGRP